MADQKQLAKLKSSKEKWNKWREEHAKTRIDLREADLSGINLSGINLSSADLGNATLTEADLTNAYLGNAHLVEADLKKADLREAFLAGANLNGADLGRTHLGNACLVETHFVGADLTLADLIGADLTGADLTGAKLCGTYLGRTELANANLVRADLRAANLSRANLSEANLTNANLTSANLTRALLTSTNFTGATLTNCIIYGIAAWNVQLEHATQKDLIITQEHEATITIDNLKVAQFIYLMLNNKEIRDVINTLTTKSVLILGRFTPERKSILDALRDALRVHNYLPILFDFEKPNSRNFTETVRTLAHLSRFIIADLSEPRSIPQELQAIIPLLRVPVKPILSSIERPYSMFEDFDEHDYHWVLPVYQYTDLAHLLITLKEQVIDPAENKACEIEKR